MNLLEVNLQPRTHPLGAPEATWRGVGVGVASGYTHGDGVDIGRRGFGEIETPAEEVGRPLSACPSTSPPHLHLLYMIIMMKDADTP